MSHVQKSNLKVFGFRAVVTRGQDEARQQTLTACVNSWVVCLSLHSRSSLVSPTALSTFIVFRDDTLFVRHGHGKITQERHIGTLIIASEVPDDKHLLSTRLGDLNVTQTSRHHSWTNQNVKLFEKEKAKWQTKRILSESCRCKQKLVST